MHLHLFLLWPALPFLLAQKIQFRLTPIHPDGAAVSVNGIKRGTTPCPVSMKRSLNGQTVQFTKDGYQQKTIELDKTFNPVSI